MTFSFQHKLLTVFDLFGNGYVLAVGVLLCTLLQSTLSNNFMHIVTMQSVYVQSALRTAIYTKTLRLRLQQDTDDGVDEVSQDSQDSQKDKRAAATTSIGWVLPQAPTHYPHLDYINVYSLEESPLQSYRQPHVNRLPECHDDIHELALHLDATAEGRSPLPQFVHRIWKKEQSVTDESDGSSILRSA